MRRILFLLVLLGPLATAACASLAGLTEVPNVADGGLDAAKDSTVVDAGRDARRTFDATFDVSREASNDAGVDGSMDTSLGSDTGVDTGPPGCQTAADCPLHQACDQTTGQCSGNCSAANACNGGCCSMPEGGACLDGDAAAACGNGTVCSTCSAPTPLCSNGNCTGSCMGAPCGAGSCCTVNGCQSGDAGMSCGSEAPCVNCTGNARGSACVAYKCGCETEADCPVDNACVNSVCTTRCQATDGGPVSQCNGGCCSNAGYCVPGTVNGNCGHGLPQCFSCGGRNGNACLNGASCGCTTELNCSALYTCSNGSCVSECDGSAGSLCHDGCCSGGLCVLGEAAGACGRAISGGTCADCTTTCMPGPGCNPVPDGGGAYACSCRNNGGCATGLGCGSRKVCMGASFAYDGGPLAHPGVCVP